MKEYIKFRRHWRSDKEYQLLFYKDSEYRIGHRENDKPSYISSDGTFFYEINGQSHRENDKPAIISADGRKYGYEHGEFIKKEK